MLVHTKLFFPFSFCATKEMEIDKRNKTAAIQVEIHQGIYKRKANQKRENVIISTLSLYMLLKRKEKKNR